jgi:hypothetical protein
MKALGNDNMKDKSSLTLLFQRRELKTKIDFSRWSK